MHRELHYLLQSATIPKSGTSSDVRLLAMPVGTSLLWGRNAEKIDTEVDSFFDRDAELCRSALKKSPKASAQYVRFHCDQTADCAFLSARRLRLHKG